MSARHRLALALALALAAAPASAQTATPAPAETPIPVTDSAPPIASKDVAIGAGIGLVGGILVLALILGSAS